jgi:hypothetical protein
VIVASLAPGFVVFRAVRCNWSRRALTVAQKSATSRPTTMSAGNRRSSALRLIERMKRREIHPPP